MKIPSRSPNCKTKGAISFRKMTPPSPVWPSCSWKRWFMAKLASSTPGSVSKATASSAIRCSWMEINPAFKEKLPDTFIGDSVPNKIGSHQVRNLILPSILLQVVFQSLPSFRMRNRKLTDCGFILRRFPQMGTNQQVTLRQRHDVSPFSAPTQQVPSRHVRIPGQGRNSQREENCESHRKSNAPTSTEGWSCKVCRIGLALTFPRESSSSSYFLRRFHLLPAPPVVPKMPGS